MNKEQKYLQELAKALVLIDNEELSEEFLTNILTPTELEEISKRLQIVKMLDAGIPQREIAEKLGVSIATITRGSRELKYGVSGFKKILEKLKD